MPVMLPPASDPNTTPDPVQQPISSANLNPPQPPPAPATPLPTAQQQNVAHSALIGHGFKSLIASMGGSTTEYQQTPDGPVPVQVKNSGGDFFRHILAGAILGAGAGAEKNDGSGTGYGGAARGIQAVQANDKQQQALRAQQAQQQFQNKLVADKAQREAAGFDTEQQVRKAQIAQANAETLKTNLLTQGASYDLHQRVADADKSRIDTFTQAGVKPVFEDIPESQMNDIMKNRPGASTLDWRHTGVKTVVDVDGNPSYQYTLSAYDPQQPLPLSKGTIDQWKKDGLFKYHPEYEDIAKPGKSLTVGQFTALDRQAQNYYGQGLAQTKNDLETQHIQAQIDEAHAAIRSHNAQTSLAGLGIQEKQQQIAEKKTLDTAWEHLAAVGNDPDRLTDSHDKIALAKAAQPAMAETLAAIKDAQANTQDKDAQDSLPGLWGRYTALTKLASLAGGHVEAVQPVTFVNPQGQQVIATTKDQIDRATKLGYTKSGSSDPEEQVQVQFPDGSTQNMSRSDLQAKKVEAAKADTSVNPAAAAFAKAKVVGPAPPPEVNQIARAAAVQSQM